MAKEYLQAVSEVYAQAIFDLAKSGSLLDEVGEDLAGISECVGNNKDFAEFLASPSITITEKHAFLQKVFSGKINPLTEDFLKVLVQRERLEAIQEINEAYNDLQDKKIGRVYGTITTAVKLDEDEFASLCKSASESLGKDVVLSCIVDPAIIGGLTLKIGNKNIDGSVRKKLSEIASVLKNQKMADAASLIDEDN